MKLTTAWGGFVGFILALAAGLAVGREPGRLLLDACVSCVIGAWLFQWLHRQFVENLRTALIAQRERAAEQSNTTGSEHADTKQA